MIVLKYRNFCSVKKNFYIEVYIVYFSKNIKVCTQVILKQPYAIPYIAYTAKCM